MCVALKEACKGCPDCNRPVRTSELEDHKTYMCTSRHANPGTKHKSEIRVWEKKLQQETNERSADKLVKTAEEQIQECFKVLPQHGKFLGTLLRVRIFFRAKKVAKYQFVCFVFI